MKSSSSCSSVKSFKDPLHGYDDICSELTSIVDSPVFQRLRWIKQTAFANLVYHGMEHSRFAHSLGVAHLAREVVSLVSANTSLYFDRRGGRRIADDLREGLVLFQLAALIHDAGHLPFSHASEAGIVDATSILSVKEAMSLPLKHEEYTMSLIPYFAGIVEGKIKPLYTSSIAGDLYAVIGARENTASIEDEVSKCTTSIYNQLLAGGIDVDRMDYLPRDSLYAGVSYGLFDVDRLVRVLVAVPLLRKGSSLSSHACSIAVVDKGLTIVESFLLSRFYMFSEVYLHRVVETYNSVYARLFSLLLLNNLIGPSGSGAELAIPLPGEINRGDQDALRDWTRLDDIELIRLLRGIVQGTIRLVEHREETRKLASIIVERRHPKTYRAVDSKKLWATYRAFLEARDLEPLGDLKEVYKELVELQRENPSLIVRPLSTDLGSIKTIRIYDRESGEVGVLEESRRLPGVREKYSGVVERVSKLAEIGIHRVIVISTTSDTKLLEKALKLVSKASSILRNREKR